MRHFSVRVIFGTEKLDHPHCIENPISAILTAVDMDAFQLLKGPGDGGYQTGCMDAIADCAALGGHLAIIRDPAENAHVLCKTLQMKLNELSALSEVGGTYTITGLFDPMFLAQPRGTCIGLEPISGKFQSFSRFILGLPTTMKSGWQWVDGTSVAYDNWGGMTVPIPSGQPDNAIGAYFLSVGNTLRHFRQRSLCNNANCWINWCSARTVE